MQTNNEYSVNISVQILLHRAFHQAKQDRSQPENVPSVFYCLDCMVHKAFHRRYCLNILTFFFRSYLVANKKNKEIDNEYG